MIKVGIIGATGYSGQELVDILLGHPEAEIACLTARFDEKVKYSDVYPRFTKRTDLCCEKLDVEKVSSECDVVFLALPHTVSMEVAPEFIKRGKKVIDMSADYRIPSDIYKYAYNKEHTDSENYEKAVFGLPELNFEGIQSAGLIANPGCYPTSVILGLLPIASIVAEKCPDIIVDSKSGTSGAGRKADIALSFSEVDENFKCYKANAHQHIPEMEYILSKAAGKEVKVNFVPHLLPLKRGILSTIYVKHDGLPPEDDIHRMYEEYYGPKPFVRLMPAGVMPEIRDAAGSNYCDIGVKVARGMLIIVSVIDNLMKGASGQAVQNMNIMCGLDERTGLV